MRPEPRPYGLRVIQVLNCTEVRKLTKKLSTVRQLKFPKRLHSRNTPKSPKEKAIVIYWATYPGHQSIAAHQASDFRLLSLSHAQAKMADFAQQARDLRPHPTEVAHQAILRHAQLILEWLQATVVAQQGGQSSPLGNLKPYVREGAHTVTSCNEHAEVAYWVTSPTFLLTIQPLTK